MKILALDTSTTFASIAISSDKTIIAEYSIKSHKTHSKTLLPNIDKMLNETGIHINEINAVVLAIGPGSFTGLRIGLSTAKGICYGQKIPLIAISTLMSLANNVTFVNKNICVLLDAGRSQVYSAIYSSELEELINPQLFTVGELINSIKEEVIFVGPCIDNLKDELNAGVKVYYKIAPSHLNYPRAASLIDIVFKKSIKLSYDYQYIANLQPFYIRRSSAEENYKIQNYKI
ncbi:MAG: tRNA (adenosine(37)-N6)-threonylcarbamoyltransferase complex dimerization subunit type 1 TsaB [Candidatus Cloacimonadota bacterium]|nr:tRNA (adenosine(37)-N6)-threonylcarbamoyltransferase complex dimerization subunit type 1 TsaB [Candidatus Cloacimonadota bacterium]